MVPDFITAFICITIGQLYPAYCTFKAIKGDQRDLFAQWLMYWVCFSLFSSAEYFGDFLLRFWLPFYNELKIFFLISLLFGQGSGAEWVYTNIISPNLMENETTIDGYIQHSKQHVLHVVRLVCSETINRFHKLARHFAAQVQVLIMNQLRENILANGTLFHNQDVVDASTRTSNSSEELNEIDVGTINDECERFTLIKEENGEYNLVAMEVSETVVVKTPTKRGRGRPRKVKQDTVY